MTVENCVQFRLLVTNILKISEMPNFCAVVRCGSRGDRDSNSFFRIPCLPRRGVPEMIALKTERRMKWILALRRKDLTECKLKYALICDRHFISGRPAALRDIYNPDWVPTQNMGYTKTSEFPIQQNQTDELEKSNKEAIVCYLTRSSPEQVPEKNIKCEVTIPDDCQSDFTYSSEERQTDQHKTQDKNKDAIVCYIKPSNHQQSQIEWTEHNTSAPEQFPGENMECKVSIHENRQSSSTCSSEERQIDQRKKQDENKDPIVCYIKPSYLEQYQIERTEHNTTDQDKDSPSRINFTDSQDKQTDPLKKQNLNKVL